MLNLLDQLWFENKTDQNFQQQNLHNPLNGTILTTSHMTFNQHILTTELPLTIDIDGGVWFMKLIRGHVFGHVKFSEMSLLHTADSYWKYFTWKQVS